MGAQAELSAVLHRLTLPLSAVLALRAGDVLPLPSAALDRVSVEGLDGRRLALGKLGQNQGSRALRLQQIGAAPPAAAPPAAATSDAMPGPTAAAG